MINQNQVEQENSSSQQQQQHEQQHPKKILIWIDNNLEEMQYYFGMAVNRHELQGIKLIQFTSNQIFLEWAKKSQHILLNQDIKIHFITNLVRPPHFHPEGIYTLRIIRAFRPDANITFYVSSVERTEEVIKQAGYQRDSHLEIVTSARDVERIIFYQFRNDH